MTSKPDWSLESSLWRLGYSVVAGVDEAGRGALAGPVVAGAVVLPYGQYPFNDSKTLGAAARLAMAAQIKEVALAWAVGTASAQEVDEVNVLNATKLAALRALAQVQKTCSFDALTTDYLKLAAPCPVLAVAKGDSLSLQIAAASILAKTTRDAHMVALAETYPAYGFNSNKGYGAPVHLNALDTHGVTPVHRLSFRPVAQRRLFESSG